MAFDKKTWANNQGGGTPLDASGLNDLESRITDSIDELDVGIGNRTYTKQNVVTNGESLTKSIDELDKAYIHYEEGVWTPTAGSFHNCSNIVLNQGRYVRIGNLVQCWVQGTMIIQTTNLKTLFTVSNPFEQKEWAYPQGGSGGFEKSDSPYNVIAVQLADASGANSLIVASANPPFSGQASFYFSWSFIAQ